MKYRRDLGIAILLALIALAIVILVSAQFFAPNDTLGQADGNRIARVLADRGRALFDPKEAKLSLEGLVDDWQAIADGERAKGAAKGIYEVTVTDNSAGFQIYFADVRRAQRFQQALTDALGPPQASCTRADLAHWSLAPHLSLSLSTAQGAGLDRVNGYLLLMASDPTDVNCQPNAFGVTRPYDDQKMRALLGRIAEKPLPLGDETGMKDWLSTYGTVRMVDEGSCGTGIGLDQPSKDLAGFNIGYAHVSRCDRERPGSFLELGYITHDMFAAGEIEKAATTILGPPDERCVGKVWGLKGKVVMALFDLDSSASLRFSTGTLPQACREK